MPQTAVVLVEDLVFSSKLRVAAQATGAVAYVTDEPAELLRQARAGAATLFLVDLNFARADALSLVAQVRAMTAPRGVPIIGFLSHVQVERAQQALQAGCTAAMPRSAFVRHLPALLREGVGALPPASQPSPAAETQP